MIKLILEVSLDQLYYFPSIDEPLNIDIFRGTVSFYLVNVKEDFMFKFFAKESCAINLTVATHICPTVNPELVKDILNTESNSMSPGQSY